jgi:hypothetical protein
VNGLESKIEPALNAMVRMPWATWEAVGDTSEYVGMIDVAVQNTVPLYSTWLSSTHYRFFCDSFVGL